MDFVPTCYNYCIMKKVIQFVYFDLGGVVELDFSGTKKWIIMKKELGITRNRSKEFTELWKKYEPEICIGRDLESLLPIIKNKFSLKLPEEYSFLIDGFVNRFEANPSIWRVIEEIQRHSKVGLLTNMYLNMFDAIKNRGILPNISWDVIIDSSKVGLQKPDPKIFEFAEKNANFHGQEILFVENSLNNVKAASEFGWRTFLYNSAHPEESSKQLLKYFTTLIKGN